MTLEEYSRLKAEAAAKGYEICIDTVVPDPPPGLGDRLALITRGPGSAHDMPPTSANRQSCRAAQARPLSHRLQCHKPYESSACPLSQTVTASGAWRSREWRPRS
jgi:hypothetical protein